jgi:histidinol-phosphate phosphatase family protein
MLNQAVIFCGGFGKRLLPITKKIPKPMANVNGKPFLFYLIEQCKNNGINKILLLCGYKSEVIQKYFGNGENLGVNIQYFIDPPQIQTYNRIYNARDFLEKKFLLLYSDNYCSLNLHDMMFHYHNLKSNFLITICNKKKGGNIFIDSKKKIIKNYNSKKNNSDLVEVGYMIINKDVILNSFRNKNESFSYLIKESIKINKVNYYLNDTGYLSISDIKRLKITRKFFNKKVVLVDRDGVLNLNNNNHYYVRNLDELKINYSFIRKFKKYLSNKKLLCITNQAGIATKDLTIKNLSLINNKIKRIYYQSNILILEFFVSHAHFLSNDFYRKPNHGLFLKASSKYGFILDRVTYIGDDIRDIEASYRAKAKCLYLGYKKLNKTLKTKYKYTLVNQVL